MPGDTYQFKYFERAKARLAALVRFMLVIILFLRAWVRVRPKAMTVAVILGGMISAPLLSMFVIPAAYYLIRRRAGRPHATRGIRESASLSAM